MPRLAKPMSFLSKFFTGSFPLTEQNPALIQPSPVGWILAGEYDRDLGCRIVESRGAED